MRAILMAVVACVCIEASAAGTAQDHANVLASRGALVHSKCSQTEGIGCGPTPMAARKACCFYGRKTIVDEGVAYSPLRRMWYAVIRYR
jgi:hypothetical protein